MWDSFQINICKICIIFNNSYVKKVQILLHFIFIMKAYQFSLIIILQTSVFTQIDAQVFSDSLLLDLNKNIVELRNQNENLKSRLELQGKSIGDISKNQNLTDQAKWDLIKKNLVIGGEIYRILSDEIVDSITDRYIELYEKIVGKPFEKTDYTNVLQRIEKNVLTNLEEIG